MSAEKFGPISFGWVDGAVVQLGVYGNHCTNTNPSSARPPYWPRLQDSPEGRRELARRIRVLAGHPLKVADDTEAGVNPGSAHSSITDERWHFALEWAAENLREELANA
jgi:hypothetical protein